MVQSLIPNLMVADVSRSVAFYCELLDFELVMAVPEDSREVLFALPEGRRLVYALVKNGVAQLMFQEQASLRQDVPAFANSTPGAAVSFYMEQATKEELEAYAAKAATEARIVKAPFDTWYGMRECYFTDPDGYVLCLACKLAE